MQSKGPSPDPAAPGATQGGNDRGARDYLDYANDPELARVYGEYQKKYAEDPRESDKKTAQLAVRCLRDMAIGNRAPRILDIGCSTGNFLRHLRSVLPNAALVGGDLMVPVVEQCRRDPALKGIQFEVMDALNIQADATFDIVTAHAVSYLFEPETYQLFCKNVAKALRPGGYFIGYELVCPRTEEYRVIEPSAWHKNGLVLWFRSEAFVTKCLTESGIDRVEVDWFDLPIDLPKPKPGSVEEATRVTHTVKEEATGRRLMFRGTLHQPWAHISARKGG